MPLGQRPGALHQQHSRASGRNLCTRRVGEPKLHDRAARCDVTLPALFHPCAAAALASAALTPAVSTHGPGTVAATPVDAPAAVDAAVVASVAVDAAAVAAVASVPTVNPSIPSVASVAATTVICGPPSHYLGRLSVDEQLLVLFKLRRGVVYDGQ